MTELFEQIAAGDGDSVRGTLGADPSLARTRNADGVTATLYALYVAQPEIAAIVADGAGRLDAFEAAALARVDELRELLEVDPAAAHAFTQDGFTPLHYASFFGDASCVEALLAVGADAQAVSRNDMRVQPLHSAAAARNVAVARLLLDAGADPNAAQQDGFLPLDAAVRNDDQELQALLRERGARTSR